jgi:hypothetical protein
LSHGLVFFMVGVKARDSREGCGRLGGLGEIFVALDANRDSDLRLPLRNRNARGGRLDHAQNAAPTAYRHVLAESNLGWHPKCNFDFGALGQGSVGEEEDSAGAEILRESDPFEGGCELAERKGKKIRKPLPNTAFNSNRRSGHKSSSILSAKSPKSLVLTLAHGGP